MGSGELDSDLKEPLSSVGVCVKGLDGTVTYQNRLCARICGDQVSRVCGKSCAGLELRPDGPQFGSEGVHLFKSRALNGQLFDLVLINDRNAFTTVFYPLAAREKEQLRILHGCGLTRRELEVMSLVIRMERNVDISRRLFISMATLKTHLNNIYKKLPDGLGRDLIRKRGGWGGTDPRGAPEHAGIRAAQ